MCTSISANVFLVNAVGNDSPPAHSRSPVISPETFKRGAQISNEKLDFAKRMVTICAYVRIAIITAIIAAYFFTPPVHLTYFLALVATEIVVALNQATIDALTPKTNG